MRKSQHQAPEFYAYRRGEKVHRLVDYLKGRERLFGARPRVAVVIGSFAALPYVHLHLEARRRFYPEVPLLVHDDASPCAGELEALCRGYGAELAVNVERYPACKGDLTAMAGGLLWAQELGVELLVKMSRRFVPCMRWVDDLVALAEESQYATYSAWTKTFNYGFRTECLAFAVEEWIGRELLHELIGLIFSPHEPFVEGHLHNMARRAAVRNTEAARAYDAALGARPRDRDGYAPWPFLRTDRLEKNGDFLWHDWAHPRDYARKAEEWGLPYGEKDFADPNMGLGKYPRDTPPA